MKIAVADAVVHVKNVLTIADPSNIEHPPLDLAHANKECTEPGMTDAPDCEGYCGTSKGGANYKHPKEVTADTLPLSDNTTVTNIIKESSESPHGKTHVLGDSITKNTNFEITKTSRKGIINCDIRPATLTDSHDVGEN